MRRAADRLEATPVHQWRIHRELSCRLNSSPPTARSGRARPPWSVARTVDGELGILPGHTPLLGVLVEGEVHESPRPARHTATIDSGFLSVDRDRVIIVAEAVDASVDERLSTERDEHVASRHRRDRGQACSCCWPSASGVHLHPPADPRLAAEPLMLCAAGATAASRYRLGLLALRRRPPRVVHPGRPVDAPEPAVGARPASSSTRRGSRPRGHRRAARRRGGRPATTALTRSSWPWRRRPTPPCAPGSRARRQGSTSTSPSTTAARVACGRPSAAVASRPCLRRAAARARRPAATARRRRSAGWPRGRG